MLHDAWERLQRRVPCSSSVAACLMLMRSRSLLKYEVLIGELLDRSDVGERRVYYADDVGQSRWWARLSVYWSSHWIQWFECLESDTHGQLHVNADTVEKHFPRPPSLVLL